MLGSKRATSGASVVNVSVSDRPIHSLHCASVGSQPSACDTVRWKVATISGTVSASVPSRSNRTVFGATKFTGSA